MKKYLFMAMSLYLATECYAATEEDLVYYQGPRKFIGTNAHNVDLLPKAPLGVAGDNVTIIGDKVGSISVIAKTVHLHLRPE